MARYPAALWKGPSPNTYGPTLRNRPRLIVAHVAQGEIAGTDSWFMEPSAQVSAHFCVAKSGEVHQYLDTDWIAWAQCSYNGVAISIEHEGFSGELLTDAQLQASVALMRWISAQYKIPLRRTANPRGSGVIGHGELGAAGCDHPSCPGHPILDQLGRALAPANPSPAKHKEKPVSAGSWNIPKPKPRHVIVHAPALSAGIAGVTGNLPHVAGVSPGEVWGILVGGSILAGLAELVLSRIKPTA